MQEVDVYYVRGKYPVFTTYLNLSAEKLNNIKERIFNYREENRKSNVSNVKAWHSDYDTHHKTDEFDSINQHIIDKCIAIDYNFNGIKQELQMFNMWVNIYEKGNFAILHNHHPGNYSCSYYVDVEEGCSPIKFPPDLEIIPKNDMLVLFKSNVYHEVPPTNGRRICIISNLDCRDYDKKPINPPSYFLYS